MNSELNHYKLGELCRVKHGYPFDGSKFEGHGTYIVLTPGNFFEKGGFKRIKGKEKYYSDSFPQEYLCSKDDLIVAMTQQADGLLGSTALVPESNLYLHNQRIGLIYHNEDLVDKLYLYYLFMTSSVRKQIADSASGTKIKHTSPEKIYSVLVSIPNIDVQARNASLLYSIDKKVEINSLICAELEAMAKILYDYWFVQFDFPDENGKPYRASGGEMVWNEQLKREIPKGWEVKCLQDICRFRNGINYEKDCLGDCTYRIANVRNITASSFLMDVDDFDEIALPQEQGNRYVLNENDIIIARSGTPGATRLVIKPSTNVIFCGFIICCTPRNPKCRLFLTCSLKQLEGTNATKTGGSILQNVSQGTLKSLQTALPNDFVLDCFNQKVEPLVQMMQNIINENRELIKLRDWLLPMLMNGQARVE